MARKDGFCKFLDQLGFCMGFWVMGIFKKWEIGDGNP